LAPDARPGVEDVVDQLRRLGRVLGLAVELLAQRVGDLAQAGDDASGEDGDLLRSRE
jgi:hypothetical protein